MWSIFKAKSLLSDEDLTFQIETFKWLLQQFGGNNFYNDTVLVQPTKQFFPAEVSSEQEVARYIFEQVKHFAGMGNWPCELVPQTEDIEPVIAPTMVIQNVPISPHGTFSYDQEKVVITYNPKLVQTPTQLVATLAHELSHYLTATASTEPPGGWDNWEFVTDLSAVFLGFGVFMSNSAFSFNQFSHNDAQGWSSQRSGYLTETELVFATAIFCRLLDVDIKVTNKHLKPHLKSVFKKSLKFLDTRPDIISTLRNVEHQRAPN